VDLACAPGACAEPNTKAGVPAGAQRGEQDGRQSEACGLTVLLMGRAHMLQRWQALGIVLHGVWAGGHEHHQLVQPLERACCSTW
jgi:hypothetical protein